MHKKPQGRRYEHHFKVTVLPGLEYLYCNGRWILQKDVVIGRMPIMLRSRCCVLHGKDEAELARLGLWQKNFRIKLLYVAYFLTVSLMGGIVINILSF